MLAVTGQVDEARLPTHVPVLAGENGLQKDSVILAEQIRTLDKRRLRERIGSMGRKSWNRSVRRCGFPWAFDRRLGGRFLGRPFFFERGPLGGAGGGGPPRFAGSKNRGFSNRRIAPEGGPGGAELPRVAQREAGRTACLPLRVTFPASGSKCLDRRIR